MFKTICLDPYTCKFVRTTIEGKGSWMWKRKWEVCGRVCREEREEEYGVTIII